MSNPSLQHTPLPWRVDSEGDFIESSSQVVCQFWDKCEDDFHNKEANADFIVRAVNSFDDMLSALKEISERDPQSSTCGDAAPSVCCNRCIGCIARSAIAKAERGQ